MPTERRWWAVWFEEYPDEGSMHVKAATREEAIQLGGKRLGCEDPEDFESLDASVVSEWVHRQWNASGDQEASEDL